MGKRSASSLKIISGVVALMLVSRVLGLVRDALINGRFGLGAQSDAYFAALFLTTGIFLSVGSALANTTIPYVVRARKGEVNYLPMIFKSVLLLGLVVTAVYYKVSPMVVSRYMASGSEEKAVLAFDLTMILMPAVLFVIMTYLFIGVLQGSERFNLPAMVSIPFNLIFFVYLLAGSQAGGIKGLAWVTTLGWALQMMLVGTAVIKGDLMQWRRGIRDLGVLKGYYLGLIPIIVITFTHTMNLMIDFRFANSFMDGSGSAINYGNTLFKALVTTAVYGVTAVMFPKFNRKFMEEDKAGLYQSVINVLRSVLLLLVPMSVGLIVFGQQVVQLIYPTKSPLTITAFTGYTSFMIAFGIIEVVNKAYYTMSRRRTPLMLTFFITGMNVVLNVALTNRMGFGGIPVATAMAYYGGAVLALYLFLRGEDNGGKRRLMGTMARAMAAAVTMGLVVWAYKAVIGLGAINGVMDFAGLGVGILMGVGTYAVMLVVVREELVVYNLKQLRERLKK